MSLVKTVNVTRWTTTDGQHFDNKVEAEQHQAVLALAQPLEKFLEGIESQRTRSNVQRVVTQFTEFMVAYKHEADNEPDGPLTEG